MNTPTLEDVRAAKQRVRDVFNQLARVVGVGITQRDGGYGVQILLEKEPPPGVELPQTVDDVPVYVEIVGEIHKR